MKIARLIQLTDEISEARKKGKKICKSSASIKNWVNEFLLSHPNEREWFCDMTFLDPERAPRRQAGHGIQMVLPVQPEPEQEIEFVIEEPDNLIVENFEREEIVEEVVEVFF